MSVRWLLVVQPQFCVQLDVHLFLRGAFKSGKFLAQLVPAVSIPSVQKSPRPVEAASAELPQHRAKWSPLPWHQMSEQNGPSKNSCHVRWWGNIRMAPQLSDNFHCIMLSNLPWLNRLLKLLMMSLAFIVTAFMQCLALWHMCQLRIYQCQILS